MNINKLRAIKKTIKVFKASFMLKNKISEEFILPQITSKHMITSKKLYLITFLRRVEKFSLKR
jgi:hypothetical protein